MMYNCQHHISYHQIIITSDKKYKYEKSSWSPALQNGKHADIKSEDYRDRPGIKGIFSLKNSLLIY